MPGAKTQLKSKSPCHFPPFWHVCVTCSTLCDSMGHSQQGSSVHGILQARILEWVCSFLLEVIFPTQGWNLCFLHCRWVLFFVFVFFFICWVIKESQAKPWSKLIQDITKSFFSFLGPLIFHVLEEKEGIEFCLLWLIRLFFTQFMFQRWVSLIFLVWREKVSFTDEKTF